MTHETKIVVGKVGDSFSSAETAVTAESFTAISGQLVNLLHRRILAASATVKSSAYTATGNGAADGTTIINTAHTEADDYWNGRTVLMLSGTCVGESCLISDFVKNTHTITLDGVGFSAQIDSGDTYALVFIEDTDYALNYLHGSIFMMPAGHMTTLTSYLIDYTWVQDSLAYKINDVISDASVDTVLFIRTMRAGNNGVATIVYTEA